MKLRNLNGGFPLRLRADACIQNVSLYLCIQASIDSLISFPNE